MVAGGSDRSRSPERARVVSIRCTYEPDERVAAIVIHMQPRRPSRSRPDVEDSPLRPSRSRPDVEDSHSDIDAGHIPLAPLPTSSDVGADAAHTKGTGRGQGGRILQVHNTSATELESDINANIDGSAMTSQPSTGVYASQNFVVASGVDTVSYAAVGETIQSSG